MKKFGDKRDWFFNARFGLFVHWGLYAINAWHEQEQMRRAVPRLEYQKLIEKFNPQKFCPDRWLDIVEAAGMKYICFTTKHHDGFCMWDTKLTDYKVTNSPYGRDILAELAEACHRRKIPLCLYYSVVDWCHPNYPNHNESHELVRPEPGDKPQVTEYIKYLRAQVRELCTNYGEIHGIWWDMNQTGVMDESIHEMIHELQPAAMINNRGLGEGYFGTPERDWDDSVKTSLEFFKPTEACDSVGSESWGYREDEDYYTFEYLIRSIDTVFAKGGNYLLNVGPDADGVIPVKALERLEKIGNWYHKTAESFSAAPASDLTENRNVLLTKNDDTIYVHLNNRPITSGVWLKPINKLPRSATLLNDGSSVKFRMAHLPNTFKEQNQQLHLYDLPIEKYSDEVIVLRLDY